MADQSNIHKCGKCKSEYQDARYGAGMRVHTRGVKGEPRCTVCVPGKIKRKMTSASMQYRAGHG